MWSHEAVDLASGARRTICAFVVQSRGKAAVPVPRQAGACLVVYCGILPRIALTPVDPGDLTLTLLRSIRNCLDFLRMILIFTS
jgi:hypothetical protein